MITEQDWRKAQEAEASNWADAGRDTARLLYELVEHSEISKQLHTILGAKKNLHAIEIGVGPLGIGFLGVHAHSYCSSIIGIEPLPIITISLDDKALEAYARILQSRVQILAGKGEALPFADNSFDLACCINVIDHAHKPVDILKQIHSKLKSGGLLLFGVNTLSFLGRLKWRFLRARQPDSFQFLAHPHIYGWARMNNLLSSLDWSKRLWTNKPSILSRVAGHGRMSFWILQKE